MENQLGRALNTPWKQWAAAGIAYAVLIIDWAWTYYGPTPNTWESVGVRFGIGVVGVVLLLIVARGDRGSVGLRILPAPSVRYWIVASLIAGAALAALMAGVLFVLHLMGYNVFGNTVPPERAVRALLLDSSVWPLVEEPTYRLLLCVGMLPLVGRWGAVLVSGAAFAFLHAQIYDAARWNNMLAGFLLAWAFVRSGSILVPLLWHALGNMAVTLLFVVSWYLQNRQ